MQTKIAGNITYNDCFILYISNNTIFTIIKYYQNLRPILHTAMYLIKKIQIQYF